MLLARKFLQKIWANTILENHNQVEKSSGDSLNLNFPSFRDLIFM